MGIRADVPAAGFHQMFEPVPSSVGRARMFARGLHEHLPENTQACLELVVSELATNAVVHAASPYEVAVSAGPPIRVEVSDASSDPPVMQRPAADGINGRGLRLVDACALQWGYALTPHGKVVWADLRS